MGKEKSTDISELIQLMFVGLMGANKEIDRVLKTFTKNMISPIEATCFMNFLCISLCIRNFLAVKKIMTKYGHFIPFITY